MDITKLHEFLQCSICFEQLDESSRVLPCQHTFCFRCLENAVSKGHSRCPECRTEFKGTPVRNLPRNVLLIRILDGMKEEKYCKETSKSERGGQATGNCTHNQASDRVLEFLPHGKALFDFSGAEAGDASFKQGNIVYLLQKNMHHWYEGFVNGMRGTVPANYIEIIVPLPVFDDTEQKMPFARALYDFEDPSDEVLSFKQGDWICFVKKVQGDSNWGEGLLGDQYGIFPFNYVELNPSANSLLSAASLSEEDLGGAAENSNEFVSPWVKLEATTKRHTIHLENPNEHETSKMLLSTVSSGGEHFHSSSDSRRASGSLLEGSTHTDAHLRRDSLQPAAQPTRRLLSSSSSDSTAGASQQNPDDLFVAVFNYSPHNSDELQLTVGKMYQILNRYEDGWVKGKDVQSGKSGMFPANYTKAVMSVSQTSRSRSDSEPSPPSTSAENATRRANLLAMARKKTTKRPAPIPPPPYSAVPMGTSSVPIGMRQSRSQRPLPDEPPPPYSAEQPPSIHAMNSRPGQQQHGLVGSKERCRVIADYPPTENDELELKVGDIVVVKKKSSDGWYKGTCLRNGRTGLFPSSFVELMTR